MECIIDDVYEVKRPNSVNSLSRSISGTFQAIPAHVIQDDDDEETDNKTMQEHIKFAKDRQEFCKSMLDTHNDNKAEQIVDLVKLQKGMKLTLRQGLKVVTNPKKKTSNWSKWILNFTQVPIISFNLEI